MKKVTAVEWLIDKLEIFATEEEMNIIDQAKEMEKKQIIEASKESIKICGMGHVFIEHPEQYYNETFKSE